MAHIEKKRTMRMTVRPPPAIPAMAPAERGMEGRVSVRPSGRAVGLRGGWSAFGGGLVLPFAEGGGIVWRGGASIIADGEGVDGENVVGVGSGCIEAGVLPVWPVLSGTAWRLVR